MRIFRRKPRIFRIAAKSIQKNGWSHGQGTRGDAVCAAVALGDAIAETSERHSMEYLDRLLDASESLGVLLPTAPAYSHYRRIVDWNDAPERTKEEVVAMLQRADRIYKGDI